MTIRDIIKILQETNQEVSFYIRKDGGVRITKLNGQSFRGSKGNAVARRMVGASLSDPQIKMLKRLKTPKGKGTYNKRRKEPVDEYTKKTIKRLQYVYRKRGYSGKPTIRGYRYNLKMFGKEEADRLLRQSELYAQGIIYSANVEYLISRFEQIYDKIANKYKGAISNIIVKLHSMKESMRYDPTYLALVDDKGPLYELEYGRIPPEEAIRRINQILDNN